MKKIIILLIVITSYISCKKEENHQKKYGVDAIIAEYAIPLGFCKDFLVKDGEVYTLYSGDRYGDFDPSIKKINKKGEVTILSRIEHLFFNNMGMALSPQKDSIYLVTDPPFSVGRNVYALPFNSNREKEYTTPSEMLTDIKQLDEDKYILVGDRESRLLLFESKSKSCTYIAGTAATRGIKDGKGNEASFGRIDNVVIINKVIYVVDTDKNLRKIVYDAASDSYNVTTLIANSPQNLRDIFSDEDNNLLVLSDKVYKFDPTNNTLRQYFIDDTKKEVIAERHTLITNLLRVKLSQPNSYTQISWSSVNRIFIDKNNLYIDNTFHFFKFSNYKKIFVK